MVNRIDNLLIERLYSPLSGWAQANLGINQWRLAIECLNGNIAFYLAGLAFSIATKGANDGIFADLLRALLWLLIMDFVRRRTLRQAASSMGVQTARMGEWLFRIILIAIVPISVWHVKGWDSLCYTISLLFLVSHLYFKASDMPPPEPRGKLAYNHL